MTEKRTKRRTLLAALAASGGAAAAAGCLQGLETGRGTGSETGLTTHEPDDPPGTTITETTHDDDARDKRATDPKWDPSGDPVETFRVGDRESVAFPNANRPHSLTFWNRVDRDREVRFTHVDGATEEAEFVGPVTVPADHTIQIELQVPTRYALTAFVDGDSFGTVAVGREWFDCNHSGTSYALGETDIVDYGTASTLVACTDPKIASTSVDVDDRECANDAGGDATIEYDGERVRVHGTFVASNPCHELSIAEASYVDETNTTHVVLDATHPEEACQDCVGAIYYRATVDFERDLPDHVTIHHRDADGNAEHVASATRNDRR